MNKSTRLLITAAAMAGLYAGSLASRAYAADEKAGATDSSKQMSKDKSSCNGKNGCSGSDKSAEMAKDKSSCNAKAKSSCNAKDKNSCTAKSSCNGKNGCSAKKDDSKKNG